MSARRMIRFWVALTPVVLSGLAFSQAEYRYFKEPRRLDETGRWARWSANGWSVGSRKPLAGFWSPVYRSDLGGDTIVTPYLVVRFRPDVSESGARLALSAYGTIDEAEAGGLPNTFRLKAFAVDGPGVLMAANALADRPDTVYAEPDAIITGGGAYTPNDPGFSVAWGLLNTGQFQTAIAGYDIKAPGAWDRSLGKDRIKVLVIDTGVQLNHPDLNVAGGHDVTTDAGNGGPVNSNDNHGTVVAGVLAAIVDNSLGTVGVSPRCPILSARTFITVNPQGGWTTQVSWTVDSLEWGRQQGVRVSNNSNWYLFQSSFIADKYAQMRDEGVVHFASAGNDGQGGITYPGNLATVNSVNAMTFRGQLASFSNRGPGIAFTAPGDQIYTTDRTGARGFFAGDYGFLSGTSYSAPFAAGVAALVLSINRFLSAADVETILKEKARDLGDPGYDTVFGWGLVDADASTARAAQIRAVGAVTFGDFVGAIPPTISLDYRRAGQTTTFDSEDVALTSSGNYATPIPLGPFSLSLKWRTFLRRTLNLDNPLGELTGVSFALVNGDVNGDNSIGIADFLQLRTAFGSSSGSANWNPDADLNGDGAVGIADFLVLRRNFGRAGDA
ncbi:MAG: S8 family serine peptidase [Fimbriimonadaceae bacterium]|nr:S8 family serine peptidase [Fimbriimonadaceae bacterium]